ncbi:hypothetical protein [Bacillus sp. FJAT-27251]|uniref:hypothetical protein n=1 Tax=Bacillus sp. FJAT-27251 TaxID=1684142 RepID=UPI000B0CC573|nr:hypothetical protein [Bacillus sp. FJAT-27251]
MLLDSDARFDRHMEKDELIKEAGRSLHSSAFYQLQIYIKYKVIMIGFEVQ